jgi:hypothetical protein
MDYRTEIIEIVRANPGATGYDIHCALTARSKCAEWFGPDAFITQLFGANLGKMYVVLHQLESDRVLRSEWGRPTPERGGRRPRHYWVIAALF